MLSLNSAKDVSVVLSAAIYSHKEVWRKMDNIEDYILRSKPPFDSDKLKDAGYEWCANFNYNKGKSLVEKTTGLNAAGIMASLSFIDATFNTYDPAKHKDKIYLFLQDERLRSKFSYALSTCLADVLEWDSDFYSFVSKIEYNCFMFGHSAITRDNYSYLGHANHPRAIAYEDRTKFGNIQSWVLFDFWKAEYLWRQYQTYKDNETTAYTNDCGETYHLYESGWCREGLLEIFEKSVIIEKGKTDNTQGKDVEDERKTVNWENIAFLLEKAPYHTIITNQNDVHVVKMFYIDKGDHLWEVYCAITTDPLQREIADVVGTNRYILYKKDHGKVNITDVINIIKDIGINADDTIASLRGNGKFVAEDSIRFDMKKCKMEDKLTVAGSPIFKSNSSLTGQALKVVVTGGMVGLGDGVDLNAQQFNFDLKNHIASIQLDEQQFGRETFHLDPSLEGRLSSRPSNQEVQAQSSEVSRQRTAKVPSKYADYSILFRNILIDLGTKTFLNNKTKQAQKLFKDFLRDELSEEQVTDEDIHKIVKEVKLVQLEPVLTDIQAIKEALGLVDSTEARRKLYRMYLVALGFSRKQANEFIKYQDYGIELSFATLENAAFYETAEIAYGSYQDHITHLNTHFAKCDRELQAIAQGQDIERGFNFLVNCLTNTEKHVEAIRGISFYKKRYKEFAEVQKYFEGKAKEVAALVQKIKAQIQAQAQGQQEQQGQQQGLDPKTQADIYNDRLKTIEKIKRTEEQSQATMARKDRELEAKIGMKDRVTQNSIETQKKMAEMRAEIDLLKKSIDLAAKQPQQAVAA